MTTRLAKMNEFGVRWPYWLFAGGFFAFGLFACYGVRFEPESKLQLLSGGIMFMLISALAVLWPLLRIREAQGTRFISRSTKRLPHRGILVPVSNAKIVILLTGGALLYAGGAGIVLTTHNNEYKVKGGIALAVYTALFAQFVYHNVLRKPGILLSENGVAWHEILLAPCFIRWEQIARAETYFHQERYSKSLSFGVAIYNVDQLSLGAGTRRKLEEHFKRHGWHLRYAAESLLEPLKVVERTVNFYRDHREAREELMTGAALNRIMDFESIESMNNQSITKPQ